MTEKQKTFVCVLLAPLIVAMILGIVVFGFWASGVAVYRWSVVYSSVTPKLVEVANATVVSKGTADMLNVTTLVAFGLGLLLGRIWGGLAHFRAIGRGLMRAADKLAESGKKED